MSILGKEIYSYNEKLPKYYRNLLLENEELKEIKELVSSDILSFYSDKEDKFTIIKTLIPATSNRNPTKITQVAYGNKIYMRKGSVFDTMWSEWKDISDENTVYYGLLDSRVNIIYPLLKLLFCCHKELCLKNIFSFTYIENILMPNISNESIIDFLHSLITSVNLYAKNLHNNSSGKISRFNLHIYRQSLFKNKITQESIDSFLINIKTVIPELFELIKPYDTYVKIETSEKIIKLWTTIFTSENIKKILLNTDFEPEKLKLELLPMVEKYNIVISNIDYDSKFNPSEYNTKLYNLKKFISEKFRDDLYF